ncbi:MAG: 4Fe-4S dicluster domain-containing protein [Desulfobacterales bacterium]|nr:4Fe-4S dicluster domain-containing protein [Desulfobacterales bacterium]
MKVIGVHRDRCTGCKTCELYCAAERGSNGKSLLKAVQETPLPQSRVRVEDTRSGPFALQCRQCQNAPCLDACLAGALVRDPETGMVLIREERCIACWTCTIFCPYGVIYPWPERKMALKCDRCNYMENPVCVEVCPTKALELVDLDDYQSQLQARRQRIAAAVAAESREGLCVLDLADKA